MPPGNMKYIYHLPYLPRRDITRILDHNNEWKELGGAFMQYDFDSLNEFGRKSSPTEALLTDWGQKNHTIDELFVLLSRMHHYRALDILLPFTNEKYHHLYHSGETNMARLLGPEGLALPSRSSGNHEKETNKPTGGSKQMVDSCNLNLPGKENTMPSKLANFPINPIHQNSKPIAINQAEISKSDNNLPGSWGTPNVAPIPSPGQLFGIPGARRDSESSSFSDASSAPAMSSIPPIDEKELAIATNLWSSASILGKGGFGTVYKGKWKNTEVAIKRMENKGLAEANLISLQQSMGELKILNTVRHDNILPLYGYSLDGDFPCLVYQFMPNGSLEDRLQCRHGPFPLPLSWEQRFNIARGTARGLQFLHTINGKPLIHGDIKSANILLDKNFEPKIGDFGLAREGPPQTTTSVQVTRVRGTRPYLPQEYLRNRKISTKVDTYSFGIVLFELGTGQRAYEVTREFPFLKDYVEEHSSRLNDMWDKKAQPFYASLYEPLMHWGLACVAYKPSERPEMVKVSQEFDSLASRIELTRGECLLGTNPTVSQNQVLRHGGQASPRDKVVPFLLAPPNQYDRMPISDPNSVNVVNAAVNLNLALGLNQRDQNIKVEKEQPISVLPNSGAEVQQIIIPDLDQLMINSVCSLPSEQIPRLDSLLNAASSSEIETAQTNASASASSLESNSSHLLTETSNTTEDVQPRARPCSVTAHKEIPFFDRGKKC